MQVIASTTLPFVLKGIMTPDEAELAVQAKAAGIVVSNHGGRVLDFAPGPPKSFPPLPSG